MESSLVSEILDRAISNIPRYRLDMINKEVFKVNEANYKEYEKFILNSYEDTMKKTPHLTE